MPYMKGGDAVVNAKAMQVDQALLRMAKTGKALYPDLDLVIGYIRDLQNRYGPKP